MYNGRSVRLDGVVLLSLAGTAWTGMLGMVILAAMKVETPQSIPVIVAAIAGALASYLTPLMGQMTHKPILPPPAQTIHVEGG